MGHKDQRKTPAHLVSTKNQSTGIFATRDPNRPNPITLSTIKINNVDGKNGTIEFYNAHNQDSASKCGVFANRSPVRPNPIGLTTAKLVNVEHESGKIEVAGFDAFDILYAEGQYRYLKTLSTTARQLADQMEEPDVDQVHGLLPTIAIEQITIIRNPRTTVGSLTDIYGLLRILFAKLGVRHCPSCARAVVPLTAASIANLLIKLPSGVIVIGWSVSMVWST